MSLYQDSITQLCLESERTQLYKTKDRYVCESHSVDPINKKDGNFWFEFELGPDLIKTSLLVIDLSPYILLPNTTIFDIIQTMELYSNGDLIDSISGSFIRDWLLLTAPNEYQKYSQKYYGQYLIPILLFFHESDTPLLMTALASNPQIKVTIDFSMITNFDQIHPKVPAFNILPPDILGEIKKFLDGKLKLQLFYRYVLLETSTRNILIKNSMNNTSTISQHQSYTFPINGHELHCPIDLSCCPTHILVSIDANNPEIEYIKILMDHQSIISIDPIDSIYTKIQKDYNTESADNIYLKVFDDDSLIDFNRSGNYRLHVCMKQKAKGKVNIHFVNKNQLLQNSSLMLYWSR